MIMPASDGLKETIPTRPLLPGPAPENAPPEIDLSKERAATRPLNAPASEHFTCIHSTRFMEEGAGGFGPLQNRSVLPIIEDLLALLPLGPAKEDGITQAQAVEVASQNYRVETKLGETVIIKRCGLTATRERIEALHEVLVQLRRMGNDVSSMIPFEKHGVCAERDGALWLAFNFIPAEHHFRGELSETKAIGKAIGKLNRDLCTLSQLDPLPDALLEFKKHTVTDHWLPHAIVQQDRYEELLELITREFKGDPYYDEILASASDIRYAFKVRDHFNELSRGTERAVQFIHGDLHPLNILMTKRGVAFIDFDLLMLRSIYTELGCAVYHAARAGAIRHVREFGAGTAEEIRGVIEAHGRVFLEQWRSEFPEVDPVSPRLIARPLNDALRRVIYYLHERYESGIDTWSFDIPAHLRGPREMIEILPLFCPQWPVPER